MVKSSGTVYRLIGTFRRGAVWPFKRKSKKAKTTKEKPSRIAVNKPFVKPIQAQNQMDNLGAVSVKILERSGAATWETKEDEIDGSKLVKHAIRVRGTYYLQANLVDIKADTIALQVVPVGQAKKPIDWEDQPGQYALVDRNMNMLGCLDERWLKLAGYRQGEEARCAVLEDKGEVCLFAIRTDRGYRYGEELEKEKQQARKEREYQSNRKLLGDSLSKSDEVIKQRFQREIVALPWSDDTVYLDNVGLELIPSPKGSTAKPHIAVKNNGRTIVEVAAKNGTYSQLARRVGETPKAAMAVKSGDMWLISMAFN